MAIACTRSRQRLKELEDALPRLGELFDVQQGVQTGCNPALLLSLEEWSSLPKRERAHFRKATMSDSIKNGIVITPYYLFFPYNDQIRPLFKNESEVRKVLPTYFEKYLCPNKRRLSNRASLKRSKRTDWWGLMEARSSGGKKKHQGLSPNIFQEKAVLLSTKKPNTCHRQVLPGFPRAH